MSKIQKKEAIEKRIAQVAAKSAEFTNKLVNIHTHIKESKKNKKTLKTAMQDVESELLDLLGANVVSIYQCYNGKEIEATFKAGLGSNEVKGFRVRVPLGTTSLSGYVALTHRPILIKDVYDQNELADIHPKLKWNSAYSESRNIFFKSMVVVPIKDEILLGVIQLINTKEGRVFTRADIKRATSLAQVLAKEFRAEFQMTQGPYDYLVQQDKISTKNIEKLQADYAASGASVTKALVEKYKVQPDDIGKSLELYYRVPYMKYDKNIVIPSSLTENISSSYLKRNLWVPVSGNKDEAIILISEPNNFERIMEIQGILNVKNFSFRVGLPEHILQFLGENFESEESSYGFDEVFKNLEEEAGVEIDEEEDNFDEQISETSAIIQLVNRVIVEANKLGASDIHIEPGKDKSPGQVRVRVDGECIDLLNVPAEHTAALIARIKVISRLDISERRLPQDGKCKLKIAGKPLELRVATMPTVNGEGAVLRILAAGSAMPLDKLALSASNYNNLAELSQNPHGLLLVVGPTGSGKTTTLHAVLGHINQPNRKIWTAEDPVEITQPRLQQVQVQPKIGFTFAMAMRGFLRADPDVILIGEMRDQETASVAIEASLTGHLVLSTLHTNSAPETITRLLDLGLDPVNFSDALLGVLAQRLMRTLCASCKEEYRPDEKELNHLVQQYGIEYFDELDIDLETIELFRASGCDTCGNTGYRGRVGVHEVLCGTKKLQSMIYHNASLEELKNQALSDGMRTLKQDGIAKIFQGLSDYEQLLKISSE